MGRPYHLVGVAGSGMSALAQLAIATGHDVTGSDRDLDSGRQQPVLDRLASEGVSLVSQDGSGVTPDTDAVIASTAIEPDNPDLTTAERLGIPILHRSELLELLLSRKLLLGVAGTCGKTTITGMLGWILEQMDMDPMVVNGGALVDWADGKRIGNFRAGSGNICVAELDESDRSFLRFSPEWAVITNIEKDHFDLDETTRLFDEFRKNVIGEIVGPGTGSLPLSNMTVAFPHSTFEYRDIAVKVSIPGRHNVENAAQALAMCEKLGVDLDHAAQHLSRFRGIERRLQVAGTANGSTVIDDFAHNPAKIRATLETLKPHFQRVIAVWRPHGFKPLEFMHTEIAQTLRSSLEDKDKVLILPVYYAGGTVDPVIDSGGFVEELRGTGLSATLVKDHDACIGQVREMAGEGDVVVVMGARDPGLPELARRIAGTDGSASRPYHHAAGRALSPKAP